MVSVGVTGLTDVEGDALTVTITGITQDEPTNTQGDGNTPIDGAGIGTSTAQVRAERSGSPRVPGNGRVYHIQALEDGQAKILTQLQQMSVLLEARPAGAPQAASPQVQAPTPAPLPAEINIAGAPALGQAGAALTLVEFLTSSARSAGDTTATRFRS